ncbi:hypothetical protein [Cobetia crustatorum]|uniref:hypothetical protein n=1 Tax=Cobetia crustatorum TaxID=553385 RepID=UPI0012EB3E33|nr:hypothetical protein [Cobetia crustatorum]
MILKSKIKCLGFLTKKSDLEKLKARIEVSREGLVNNPLDIDLETTITELRLEVVTLIYSGSWVNPLPESHKIIVDIFILSFNEVASVAKRNNRGLYFSAQRSVF